jgi:hypothetical protein
MNLNFAVKSHAQGVLSEKYGSQLTGFRGAHRKASRFRLDIEENKNTKRFSLQ